MYITGRFDIIHDENSYDETIEDFISLVEYISATEYIMCYEDKSKLGLSVKPHTHFFINVPEHLNIKQIRYFISTQLGYVGTHSSLKTIPQDNKTKALCYISKQKRPMIYTYTKDELENILSYSHQYNEKLEISSKELIDIVIENIKLKKLWKRKDYLKEIFDVFYDYPENKKPNYSNLLSTFQYIERKTLLKDIAYERYYSDNNSIANSIFTNDNWLELQETQGELEIFI